MNDGYMHEMGGMATPPTMNGTGGMHHHKMMMHMSFFWGMKAEVLFSGWPGKNGGMYVLALIFVFAMSFLVEWLPRSRLIKPGTSDFAAGLIQTLMHAIRVGLAYMVMLAVMSFNAGVFLVAIAGHALGFLLFGSKVFEKPEMMPPYEKTPDLPPPMSC